MASRVARRGPSAWQRPPSGSSLPSGATARNSARRRATTLPFTGAQTLSLAGAVVPVSARRCAFQRPCRRGGRRPRHRPVRGPDVVVRHRDRCSEAGRQAARQGARRIDVTLRTPAPRRPPPPPTRFQCPALACGQGRGARPSTAGCAEIGGCGERDRWWRRYPAAASPDALHRRRCVPSMPVSIVSVSVIDVQLLRQLRQLILFDAVGMLGVNAGRQPVGSRGRLVSPCRCARGSKAALAPQSRAPACSARRRSDSADLVPCAGLRRPGLGTLAVAVRPGSRYGAHNR